MNDVMTVSISMKGQAVLPLKWRKENGLTAGGVCDGVLVRDGKGSLMITPRPKRKGAKGLLKFILAQDASLPPVKRHKFPSK